MSSVNIPIDIYESLHPNQTPHANTCTVHYLNAMPNTITYCTFQGRMQDFAGGRGLIFKKIGFLGIHAAK